MNQLNPKSSKQCVLSCCVQDAIKLHEEQMELLKCGGCPNKMKQIGQQLQEMCDEMSPEEGDAFTEHLIKQQKCNDCAHHKH